jgi:hypothetical protein
MWRRRESRENTVETATEVLGLPRSCMPTLPLSGPVQGPALYEAFSGVVNADLIVREDCWSGEGLDGQRNTLHGKFMKGGLGRPARGP